MAATFQRQDFSEGDTIDTVSLVENSIQIIDGHYLALAIL